MLTLELEASHEELQHSLTHEREELLSRYEAEKEELSKELVAVQQEWNESLLLAENEKQQVKGRGWAGLGPVPKPVGNSSCLPHKVHLAA